jgi:DNA-binding PadR family transcriptional regulator
MDNNALYRGLFLGFVRVHVLHHCAKRPWYGQELLAELSEHGYRFSYGTLYPILHSMEGDGLLAMTERLEGGRWRKYYRATANGKKALAEARKKVRELSKELEEDADV